MVANDNSGMFRFIRNDEEIANEIEYDEIAKTKTYKNKKNLAF